MKNRKIFAVFLLSLTIFFADRSVTANHVRIDRANVFFADKFYRTELYFGTDIKGGGKVSAEDWDKFLAAEVTTRFPDGFTVLEGYGQYKDSDGKIVREASKVLIVFYPKNQRSAAGQKLEAIRDAYKKQFEQESVLRVDYPKALNVRF